MSRGRKCLKRIKKDYQHKNLTNPFFHQPKKKMGRRLFTCLLISGIAIIIFLFWFFLAAPVWRIKNIKIEGLTRIADADLAGKIWEQAGKNRYGIFKQTNIWLFDKDKAREEILASYNLASLEIAKRPTGTLIIKVGERPYSFIFQQGSEYFYASREGYIIREAAVSEDDKTRYTILENRNAGNLIDDNNRINISDDYLGFFLELSSQIAARPELPIERFIIDQEYNTVKVKFRDGPLAYFNTKSGAKDQVDRLIIVKNEKIKDNFNKTNYIDLRYGDRIFLN